MIDICRTWTPDLQFNSRLINPCCHRDTYLQVKLNKKKCSGTLWCSGTLLKSSGTLKRSSGTHSWVSELRHLFGMVPEDTGGYRSISWSFIPPFQDLICNWGVCFCYLKSDFVWMVTWLIITNDFANLFRKIIIKYSI